MPRCCLCPGLYGSKGVIHMYPEVFFWRRRMIHIPPTYAEVPGFPPPLPLHHPRPPMTPPRLPATKKGDVSCPAFEFIYIYFSFTLSRLSFQMNSSFIFCDVIFAFVLVLPCMQKTLSKPANSFTLIRLHLSLGSRVFPNGQGSQLGAAWSGQEVCSGFALAARATRSRLGIRPRRLRYSLAVRALP